jgi:PD-(D/E)XK nuclease superfamily
MTAEEEREHLNLLSNRIIGAALRVHEELDPGMLESAYEACLMYELLNQGFFVERQKAVPVTYRGNQQSGSAQSGTRTDGAPDLADCVRRSRSMRTVRPTATNQRAAVST